jgi:hypothetical protein
MTLLTAHASAKSITGSDITAAAVTFLTQARFEALPSDALRISRRKTNICRVFNRVL